MDPGKAGGSQASLQVQTLGLTVLYVPDNADLELVFGLEDLLPSGRRRPLT
jgi:hypothetical protein